MYRTLIVKMVTLENYFGKQIVSMERYAAHSLALPGHTTDLHSTWQPTRGHLSRPAHLWTASSSVWYLWLQEVQRLIPSVGLSSARGLSLLKQHVLVQHSQQMYYQNYSSCIKLFTLCPRGARFQTSPSHSCRISATHVFLSTTDLLTRLDYFGTRKPNLIDEFLWQQLPISS